MPPSTSTTPTKPPPTRTTSTRFTPQTHPPKKPLAHNPSSHRRPPLKTHPSTLQTRYISMLLAHQTVPLSHNILAAAFVWILLAGYIVFPATFNKIQRNESLDDHRILSRVKNVPLLYVAAFACGVGVFGCVWLWWVWRKNYVWVVNRIFGPALMNSLAGLVGTVVNVYSAQDGQYSVTAKVTIIVTSACSVCAAALFLIYNCVMLAMVKRRHEKDMRASEQQQQQGQNGGVMAEEENEREKGVGRKGTKTLREEDAAGVV